MGNVFQVPYRVPFRQQSTMLPSQYQKRRRLRNLTNNLKLVESRMDHTQRMIEIIGGLIKQIKASTMERCPTVLRIDNSIIQKGRRYQQDLQKQQRQSSSLKEQIAQIQAELEQEAEDKLGFSWGELDDMEEAGN